MNIILLFSIPVKPESKSQETHLISRLSFSLDFFSAANGMNTVGNIGINTASNNSEQVPLSNCDSAFIEAIEGQGDAISMDLVLPQAPPLCPNIALARVEQELGSYSGKSLIAAYHLGRFRYLTLSTFGGKIKVHIRQFPRNPTTKVPFPSENGIHLDHVQARSLVFYLPQIRSVMTLQDRAPTLNWHLGLYTFASINTDYGPTLDLRHFFVSKNEKNCKEPNVEYV